MTKFINTLADNDLEIAHGPIVEIDDAIEDRQIAIGGWLAEYVIDNCETNEADVMTLDEALGAYAVVFADDEGGRYDVYLTAIDLGDVGAERFEKLVGEFEAA